MAAIRTPKSCSRNRGSPPRRAGPQPAWFDVEFRSAALVAVTGVSGSGKSTLIENVLYGTYQRSRGVVDGARRMRRDHRPAAEVVDVTMVDQRPLGRSWSRSNPVTYPRLRRAAQALRRDAVGAGRGITPSALLVQHRSRARPTCQGTGVVEVDMQFMAPVTVTCDTCQHRFQPRVLSVRLRGRNIAETLSSPSRKRSPDFAGPPAPSCNRLRNP